MASVSNRLGINCLVNLFISALIIPTSFQAVNTTKPICDQQEACAIHIGVPLPLPCTCGSDLVCGKERLPQYKNIKHYQRIPICETGEIAMLLDGYRHKFNCVCPNQLDLVSVSWDPLADKTIYACSILPKCEADQVCQRKVKIVRPQRRSNLRSLCRCQGSANRCKSATTYRQNSSEITDWTCV